MISGVDPVRFQAATARFVAFFNELSATFVEREDVLMQIALALLCREHVLLTGPPGTAKSLLASAVFERLIDEETGSPSLYARQFTESTVQTDLIGPINFKTLTETGRTEHFTDEGMLGAVHAFLDEVFDGRDMLLRAALNMLHERELKQGTRITRGRFECAIMATNRYLAEVLESSRETLLAFVDRIAFAGFVPRGFADPAQVGAVLKRQVGDASRRPLEAPLTIQDLDALQAVVASVYVSDPICDGLSALLELLDAELNAAVRADPSFIPTRYLSTRTAVRSGQLLRGICVYDKLFRDPERPLEVLPGDLAGLRLHLLLSGPPPDAVAKLLTRETEARERRQLEIVRTEREIFDRCLAKLPPIRVSPRPVASPVSSTARARAGVGLAAVPAGPERTGERPTAQSPLEEKAARALQSRDPKWIAAIVRELVPVSHGGGAAAGLLKECVAALHAQALRVGLAAGGGDRLILTDVVDDLSSLADTLEQATGGTRPLARWLRARALALIGDAAGYSLGALGAELAAAAPGGERGSAMGRAEQRLKALEDLATRRSRLVAQGVEASGREGSEAAWARGLKAAEEDVALLCDAGIQDAVAQKLAARGAGDLATVLAGLAAEFDWLERLGQRLAAQQGASSDLPARVLGPRLGALVEASLRRIDASDRAAFKGQVEALLDVLAHAGLGAVIPAKDWVRWTADALVRSERPGGPPAEARADAPHDHEGYRRLRSAAPRGSNALVLAESALRVGSGTGGVASPEGGVASLSALFAEIPEPARREVVELDFARIERAVAYLDAWWSRLAGAAKSEPGAVSTELAEERLRELVASRFFEVLMDESALVRFVLEARLVAELFPDHEGRAAAVRARIDDLQERTRATLAQLVRSRADAAWSDTVRGP